MKRLAICTAAVLLSMTVSIPAFAGSWQQNGSGWWYQNNDGSWPTNTWQWIDGKCYYFDENGYMLAGTAVPDGSFVNADGAWVVDGVVQTQGDDIQNASADPYDNAQNRAALAAYLYDLKNSADYDWYYDSQNGGRSLTMDPHITVFDANGDGVYEVFVYCGGPESLTDFWLLYYNNGVKKMQWRLAPTIGTLGNGQFFVTGGDHGFFWGELYDFTGSEPNRILRMEYNMMNNNFETVQAQIEQYADQMVTYQSVYLSDENLNRYLGGAGESTGVR